MTNQGSGPVPPSGLLTPPHIVPLLMDLLAGGTHPERLQQEHIESHLAECEACRTALIFLLCVALGADSESGLAETAARDLVARFATINDAIEAVEARGFERWGAYAEAILARGREVAGRDFPALAAHIEQCSACRSALESTLAFISEEDAPL